MVEDKAVLFKKGNIENLREKLQMLCDDTELTDMYKKDAAEFIRRKYNWDDVVQRTLALYEETNDW